MKKPDLSKLKDLDVKKAARDFWYGKPHGERRLGDLYIPKTGLYKHREWRGFKDTMYYFNNIWLYNYGMIVRDIMVYGGGPKGLVQFLKGTWRYRWMGQTYLTVMHWFDRCLEGMRGETLAASAWHFRGIVSACLYQITGFFNRDLNIGGDPALRAKTIGTDETVWGGIIYPYMDQGGYYLPTQMIPYFVTCHCNNHTVLNYIDAVQAYGLPGDPCPMCQAEAGIYIEDDVPDSYVAMVTTNEACDSSVGTSVIQDWMMNKPLFAMPQVMQFDDDSVLENCAKEIEMAWRFMEEQTGLEFHWEELKNALRKSRWPGDSWKSRQDSSSTGKSSRSTSSCRTSRTSSREKNGM